MTIAGLSLLSVRITVEAIAFARVCDVTILLSMATSEVAEHFESKKLWVIVGQDLHYE